MNVLILGGSGFIGYHLIKALKKNNIDPCIVDINPPLAQGSKYIQANLCKINPNNPVFKDVDLVYHLACTTIPATSNKNPQRDITTNLSMSIKILDACVQNKVKKVIFLSSGGVVYGIPLKIPIKENHPTNPICSYGITKLMVEKYFYQYAHNYGLNYIILRASNPFGEYQNPLGKQGAVSVFLGNLAKSKPIRIWGDGSVVRDYLYIEDLVDAMLRSMDYSPAAGSERILNVGSGKGMSLKDIIDLITKVTKLNPIVQYAEPRTLDVNKNILDISLIRNKLGWFPKWDMFDAIGRTWDWVKLYSNEKKI